MSEGVTPLGAISTSSFSSSTSSIRDVMPHLRTTEEEEEDAMNSRGEGVCVEDDWTAPPPSPRLRQTGRDSSVLSRLPGKMDAARAALLKEPRRRSDDDAYAIADWLLSPSTPFEHLFTPWRHQAAAMATGLKPAKTPKATDGFDAIPLDALPLSPTGLVPGGSINPTEAPVKLTRRDIVLGNAKLMKLCRSVRFVRHTAGSLIYEQDNAGGEAMYFVLRGQLDVWQRYVIPDDALDARSVSTAAAAAAKGPPTPQQAADVAAAPLTSQPSAATVTTASKLARDGSQGALGLQALNLSSANKASQLGCLLGHYTTGDTFGELSIRAGVLRQQSVVVAESCAPAVTPSTTPTTTPTSTPSAGAGSGPTPTSASSSAAAAATPTTTTASSPDAEATLESLSADLLHVPADVYRECLTELFAPIWADLDARVELLQSLPYGFDDWDPVDVMNVCQWLEPRHLRRGETFYRQNTPCRNVAFVRQGQLMSTGLLEVELENRPVILAALAARRHRAARIKQKSLRWSEDVPEDNKTEEEAAADAAAVPPTPAAGKAIRFVPLELLKAGDMAGEVELMLRQHTRLTTTYAFDGPAELLEMPAHLFCTLVLAKAAQKGYKSSMAMWLTAYGRQAWFDVRLHPEGMQAVPFPWLTLIKDEFVESTKSAMEFELRMTAHLKDRRRRSMTEADGASAAAAAAAAAASSSSSSSGGRPRQRRNSLDCITFLDDAVKATKDASEAPDVKSPTAATGNALYVTGPGGVKETVHVAGAAAPRRRRRASMLIRNRVAETREELVKATRFARTMRWACTMSSTLRKARDRISSREAAEKPDPKPVGESIAAAFNMKLSPTELSTPTAAMGTGSGGAGTGGTASASASSSSSNSDDVKGDFFLAPSSSRRKRWSSRKLNVEGAGASPATSSTPSTPTADTSRTEASSSTAATTTTPQPTSSRRWSNTSSSSTGSASLSGRPRRISRGGSSTRSLRRQTSEDVLEAIAATNSRLAAMDDSEKPKSILRKSSSGTSIGSADSGYSSGEGSSRSLNRLAGAPEPIAMGGARHGRPKAAGGGGGGGVRKPRRSAAETPTGQSPADLPPRSPAMFNSGTGAGGSGKKPPSKLGRQGSSRRSVGGTRRQPRRLKMDQVGRSPSSTSVTSVDSQQENAAPPSVRKVKDSGSAPLSPARRLPQLSPSGALAAASRGSKPTITTKTTTNTADMDETREACLSPPSAMSGSLNKKPSFRMLKTTPKNSSTTTSVVPTSPSSTSNNNSSEEVESDPADAARPTRGRSKSTGGGAGVRSSSSSSLASSTSSSSSSTGPATRQRSRSELSTQHSLSGLSFRSKSSRMGGSSRSNIYTGGSSGTSASYKLQVEHKKRQGSSSRGGLVMPVCGESVVPSTGVVIRR